MTRKKDKQQQRPKHSKESSVESPDHTKKKPLSVLRHFACGKPKNLDDQQNICDESWDTDNEESNDKRITMHRKVTVTSSMESSISSESSDWSFEEPSKIHNSKLKQGAEPKRISQTLIAPKAEARETARVSTRSRANQMLMEQAKTSLESENSSSNQSWCPQGSWQVTASSSPQRQEYFQEIRHPLGRVPVTNTSDRRDSKKGSNKRPDQSYYKPPGARKSEEINMKITINSSSKESARGIQHFKVEKLSENDSSMLAKKFDKKGYEMMETCLSDKKNFSSDETVKDKSQCKVFLPETENTRKSKLPISFAISNSNRLLLNERTLLQRSTSQDCELPAKQVGEENTLSIEQLEKKNNVLPNRTVGRNDYSSDLIRKGALWSERNYQIDFSSSTTEKNVQHSNANDTANLKKELSGHENKTANSTRHDNNSGAVKPTNISHKNENNVLSDVLRKRSSKDFTSSRHEGKPEEIKKQCTKPEEIEKQFTKPEEIEKQFTKPEEIEKQFTKPEEIEKQFTKPEEYRKQYTRITSFRHLSVSEPILIDDYAAQEWKGETTKADKMRRGYEAIKAETGYVCIRRVRGDNYCAIRAVLFKTLSCGVDITTRFHEDADIAMLPLLLLGEQYKWMNQWSFAGRLDLIDDSVEDTLVDCLTHLKDAVRKSCSCHGDDEGYKIALDLFNGDDQSEIRLFEAVKFLMLYSSVKLFNAMQSGEDCGVLPMLLFARDTSPDPEAFMRNHLNHVGDSAGFDQLEMMLLGHTLKIVIKVMRLNHVDEPDFIAEFSDGSDFDAESIFVVAEDDRHYNVLSEEM